MVRAFARRRGNGKVRVGLMVALLVLAIAGALLAAYFQKPTYESTALIRIARTQAGVLGPDRAAPDYATLMESQRELAHSRRVLDTAAQDPVWKATGAAVPPADELERMIEVRAKPRSEYIEIVARHRVPTVAATAVTAVTNAYAELFTAQEQQVERQRSAVLDERAAELQSRLDQLAQRRAERTKAFGTADLQPLHDAAILRLTKIESALADVQIARAKVTTVPAATQPATAQELAAQAEQLTKLLDEAKRDAAAIGAATVDCRKLDAGLAQLQDDLRTVHRRIDALRTEGSLGGRLTIVSTGEVPTGPDNHWTFKSLLTPAGACAAAALLLALILAFVLARRA